MTRPAVIARNAANGAAIKYSTHLHSDLGSVVKWPTHIIITVGNMAWSSSAMHFNHTSVLLHQEMSLQSGFPPFKDCEVVLQG